VVVGDTLILTEGSYIPADARLIETVSLKVNESALTGESSFQEKRADVVLPVGTPIQERVNSIFAGTTVLSGEGKAIVTDVGINTEFGKIAGRAAGIKREKTILQVAMSRLVKTLVILALGVSALIPLIGFLRGFNLQDMIITWLALTFLMIPGQPPIIITMALALSSFELAGQNLIVKHLHGAEVLGQITSLISDKTGTITENRMKVSGFVLPGGNEVGIEELSRDMKENIIRAIPRYSKDPTDVAVKDALIDFGEIAKNLNPISIKGFSLEAPWRAIRYESDSLTFQAISGKPELLIDGSTLTDPQKIKLNSELERLSQTGDRVVAYACQKDGTAVENFDFVALAVLVDPVRQGVKAALKRLNVAGIKTFIVTGDHPVNTLAILREVGLKAEVLTGGQMENLNDVEFSETVKKHRVFTRVTPSQKLRLVEVLKRDGEVVGVIGDGINDVPAIKAGDVGIAMGEIGTDLAKETADLVLTDDNYVHIPEAVSIGRKALDNFKKGLTYYLSAKSILLSIFVVPLVLGIPFPFAPIHIILVELLMDLASSTIFVSEAAEPDNLSRPPQRILDFLNTRLIGRILLNSFGLALGILIIYLLLYFQTGDVILAQTAAFTSWLLGHIFLAMNLKQEKIPLFTQGYFSNHFAVFWLLGMISFTLVMTLVTSLYPYLKTTALPFFVWLWIIIIVIASTFWIEVAKTVRWKNARVPGIK
jgi:P-type Ca2+ transporter type 2C